MVIIAVIVHPSSLLAKVFAAKPLVWIGLHSYGMYLWHYPILLLMNPRSNIDGTPWWMYLVELAIIFAIGSAAFNIVGPKVLSQATTELFEGLVARWAAPAASTSTPSPASSRRRWCCTWSARCAASCKAG